MTSELAVETHTLRKLYGRKLAVSDCTLAVRRGEAFGLLGPNGAGKSTCVKMLLGLVRPTAGTGQLLGEPLGAVAARRRVGFLPEHFHFQDWLSGTELLHLHGRLLGMEAGRLRQRVPELLERVELGRQGRKPIREYSKGMQQRVGLAQALLQEPDIVFLDEPTSGLDPLGRMLVRDLIAEQRQRGATVFLNSHLLGEVEVSCDRVAFVKAGRVLETRDLRAPEAVTVVNVRARSVPRDGWGRLGIQGRRQDDASASDPAKGGDPPEAWRFELPRPELLPELLRLLVDAGAEVFEYTPRRDSLEETFLRVVGHEGDGQ
ncbi:MAG TPA: ABC transporter ATP-binding protein [Terriglobales bacterium]